MTSGYRNKCEFTIGYQNVLVKKEKNGEAMEVEEKEQEVKVEEKEVEKEVSVGFRLASYKVRSKERLLELIAIVIVRPGVWRWCPCPPSRMWRTHCHRYHSRW